MNQIQKLETWKKDLALAETFEEIKLHDSAAAAAAEFARRERLSLEKQNEIGKFRISVETKKGEWLDENFSQGGKNKYTKMKLQPMELHKMPVNNHESSRARKIRNTEEEKLEQIMHEIEERGEVITPNNVHKEIKKQEKKKAYIKNKEAFEKPILKINKEQEIIEGDSRKILKTLNKKTYDLLLSDPPYGMDFKSGWNTKDKIQNDKIEDTVVLFEEVLKECVPLLKNDAHFYLFGNINYLTQIKPIVEKYLTLKNILIWDRQIIGMGDLKSYGNSYDIVYFGYNKKWKDLNGTRDRDILNFQRVDPAKNIHPTEKPLDMLEYLIKKSSQENDKILEPFAGGGSTLVAAKNTNRKATGIEIENKYVELIKQRI